MRPSDSSRDRSNYHTLNAMPLVHGFDVLREAAQASPRSRERTSPAAERLRAEALRIARDDSLVHAAYGYRIVPLEAAPAATLRAGGEQLHAPKLLPVSGQLTALACAVCTLGPRIEERVRALFTQGRPSLAMALDSLANELLFEVSRRAQDRMYVDVTRQGRSLAGELRPGDPGLALDAQPAVLRLAGAEALGVTVNDGLLMRPHKSTSMVLGVGIDLPPAEWSRCDECPRRSTCRVVTRAHVRKAAAAPTAAAV